MSITPESTPLHLIAAAKFRRASSIPEAAQWHRPPDRVAGLRQLLYQQIPGDAHVVWVAPKRRSARSLIPGPVIAGRPVALMFADEAEELAEQWMAPSPLQSTPLRAVLAQWDADYLPLGHLWLRAFRKNAMGATGDWMANKIGGPRLCRRLARGARLCVYFGHGHHDGIAAYHGVYFDDVLAESSRSCVETFISYSCQHLAQPNGRPCFGRELVRSGRVRAFWGAVGHVDTEANRELARLGIQTLLTPEVICVADWIQNMDTRVHATKNRSLRSAWRLYRLVGNPQALI